jgi:hypothetical protein
VNWLLDLYVEYLICTDSYTTSTEFSRLMNNEISHDQMTRCLSKREYTSSDLWIEAKPLCKAIEAEDGILALDDTVEEKPYTDKNLIVEHYWSSKDNRHVKGINIVSALYVSDKGSVPVGFEIVRKDTEVIDKKTGKKKKKASISKQMHYQQLIKRAVENNVNFKYVTNDTWYTTVENMNLVLSYKKHFVMAFPANRRVALSEADRAAGKFVRIDSLELEEGTVVWLPGFEFPIRLVRCLFKDDKEVTHTLYLGSSDTGLTDEQITVIYKKRWKIETYHQSLKDNASLDKSPTKTPTTQINHIFASLCAFIRIERLSLATKKAHRGLKDKLRLAAIKNAREEFRRLERKFLSHAHTAPA